MPEEFVAGLTPGALGGRLDPWPDPGFVRTRRRSARPPRRGRMTKSFMSSLRLTISLRSNGTLATAASTCHALWPLSAHTSSSQGNQPSRTISTFG